MNKLLSWIDSDKEGIKIARGKNVFYAYQKMGKKYLLVIESGDVAVRLTCKTERDCLMISNILNK